MSGSWALTFLALIILPVAVANLLIDIRTYMRRRHKVR